MLARDVYHRDPDELLDQMSALKFAEWQVMYSEESLTPDAQRAQMALLLAGVHNGGRFVPQGTDRWSPQDFHPATWEPAADPAGNEAPAQSLDDIRARAREAGMEV